MSEPFLGMIIVVPYNFAPRGWAFCNGQLLPIQQNSALFALIGVAYGGDGVTTFRLPDLRGRAALSAGSAQTGSSYVLGQVAGAETTTLTLNNLPSHTHVINVVPPTAAANVKTGAANTRSPANALPAVEAAGVTAVYNNDGGPANATLASTAITLTGGSATASPAGNSIPISLMQPYLALNYCIALEGIFPSRD